MENLSSISIHDSLISAYKKGYEQGHVDGKNEFYTKDENFAKGFQHGKEEGLCEAWDAAKTFYNIWFNNLHQDPNRFADIFELDAKLGESVFEHLFKLSPAEAINKLKKYNSPCICVRCKKKVTDGRIFRLEGDCDKGICFDCL